MDELENIPSFTNKMEHKHETEQKEDGLKEELNFYDHTTTSHGSTVIRVSLEQSEPTHDRVNHYERLGRDINDDLDTAGNQITSIQSQPIDEGINQYERLRIDETISKRNKIIQDDVQNRDKFRSPLDKKERKEVNSRYYRDVINRINDLRKYLLRQNRIMVVIFSILIFASYAFVVLSMILVVKTDDRKGKNMFNVVLNLISKILMLSIQIINCKQL